MFRKVGRCSARCRSRTTCGSAATRCRGRRDARWGASRAGVHELPAARRPSPPARRDAVRRAASRARRGARPDQSPSLVLIDEPSAGFAPSIVDELLETLNEVRRIGVTMLLVEQNIRFGLRLADHAVLLQRGRVVYEGKSGELDESGARRAARGGTAARQRPQVGSGEAGGQASPQAGYSLASAVATTPVDICCGVRCRLATDGARVPGATTWA